MFSKILARTAVAAAAAGLALTASVGSASASTSSPYVGYGYTNNPHAVWCVQHLANDIARDLGHGTVAEDGIWGNNTYNQVRWVQTELGPYEFGGVKVDGIVGPQTGYLLLNNGDEYYGGNNYCLGYVPSTTNDMPPPGHVVLD
ncbi:peptidoglycan-binding domain-containing protein [Streptomyces sp. NPDC051976]|uniref:peptidoglycan-binding domain-containing protein n=1 Tax=Streptomyces sp. NPDC051976 TaxID=3154947 RepID=UPI003420021F